MNRWLVLAVSCPAATAGAQPVTRPGDLPACRVSIAYAPDEVRAEIEAWVRAEPRCERELEVRVVPTDDGLYLQARDERGRVRERVVPDAQSAAVLVVSWMADDSLGPSHTPMLERPSYRPSVAPGMSDPETPPGFDDGVVAAMPPRARRAPRSWMLGAVGSEETGGLRAQIDLFAGRRWTLGVGGGFRAEHDSEDDKVAQARLVFATTRTFGRLSLRLQLGVGVDATKPERMDHDETMDSSHRGDGDIVPRAEAGAFAAFEIARGWGLVGGPLVEKGRHDDAPTFSLFLGVSRGL